MTDIWLTHSKITQEAEAKHAEACRIHQEAVDKERACRAKSKQRQRSHKRASGVPPVYGQPRPLSEFCQKLLDTMKNEPDRIWTTQELSDETCIARGCVGDALRTLCNRNFILRSGISKRYAQDKNGYTYQYLKAEVGDE